MKKALHSEKIDKAKFKRWYENELAKEKKEGHFDKAERGHTIGKLNLQPVL